MAPSRQRRTRFQLLTAVLVACLAGSAAAAPRDAAARKKIEQAVHKHYLLTDFDRAEKILVGTVKACGSKCSPNVIATAWMYAGIVRGSGKDDQKGAKEAFVNALAADPNVTFDKTLATPKTKKTYAAARLALGLGDGGDGGLGLGAGGAMSCSPKVTEIQTRRPVPVSCTAGEDAKELQLQYKSGSAPWKRLEMKKKRGTFQVTIPCQATARVGSLRFYVRARNDEGNPVESFGKRRDPLKVEIVRNAEEEPPAFPDKEPPARCSRAEASGDLQDQSCEEDADCPSGGRCVDSQCEGRPKKSGPYKKSWLGVHFAYDFALVGGSEVCSQDAQRDGGFACYYPDTEERYGFDPNPDAANSIKGGLAPATYRALLSFDQVISANISAGLRLGYAFGGGPPAGTKNEAKFLPFHAELRLSYWFGDAPFGQTGLRPFIGVQAGAAQVDAKLTVNVGDCAGTPGGPPSQPGAQVAQDFAFYQACSDGVATGSPLDLDVYKKLGKVFGGIHGGAVYAFSPDSGIKLNLNVIQLFPTTGQAFEPSLGYVQGL